ncbi:MAG: c-type cytochrome [Gammaproteobacteria bacterium]|nr:c-type cytochrome [Gammaproteobacteria bacterium]
MPTGFASRFYRLNILSFVGVSSLISPVLAQDRAAQFENLQVLPPDISQNDLGEVMLGNLRGLGLRRLAGEGCLFCHVGDMERPRDTWDYASDDKPTKRKARVMMAMVQAINQDHLANLETRIDPTHRVTCYTCHAGRTDPRPLATVLWEAYEAGGIDTAQSRYDALRGRYFGGDAYDFRGGVLVGIATRMADRGAFDDAIAMAALNVEVFPSEAAVKRPWVRLLLERTLNVSGVAAALDELDRMEPELAEGVVSPGLLDALGWRMFRQGRKPEATAILSRNLEKFPEEYIPNESMAFILRDRGELESALQVLEQWLDKHPNHDRARQLLINMRGG